MIARTSVFVDGGIVGNSLTDAKKVLINIYFRRTECFASAFEKSDCFIYIEGEEAKLGLYLKNLIWRTNR